MPELIYVGHKKGWLPGVPARDLSADEVERHGRDRLIASGLYAEPQSGEATDFDAIAAVQEIADGTDEEE